jgi:hypothetical protein
MKPQSEEEQRLKKLVSKGLVMMAGLLAAPGSSDVDQQVTEVAYSQEPGRDIREARIAEFMEERDAPASQYAEDFVLAADQNNLDWRLLPSIAMLESGGGKNCRNNNIFGWQNCERRFPSVQDGIHLVARSLANSRLYRDKSLDELLSTYNPIQDYRARVKAVMRMLGPEDPVTEVSLP